MLRPFEEPSKTEMRASSEVAIDQSGHELVETPIRIDLPAQASLQGRLKGDLQSLDGEGSRYCYYLRPGAEDTLPEWLANLATASHEMSGVKLYIVVEEASPAFERACRVAGAGLLVINEDREFEQLLDFDSTLPEATDEAFQKRITTARRDLEMKVDLHQTELQGRFERVTELTQGMAADVADRYSEGVERQYRIWTTWGDQISVRLDGVRVSRNLEELRAIEEEIERGPVLDADV